MKAREYDIFFDLEAVVNETQTLRSLKAYKLKDGVTNWKNQVMKVNEMADTRPTRQGIFKVVFKVVVKVEFKVVFKLEYTLARRARRSKVWSQKSNLAFLQ